MVVTLFRFCVSFREGQQGSVWLNSDIIIRFNNRLFGLLLQC